MYEKADYYESIAAKVRHKPSLNKGLPVSTAFSSATKSITSLKHSRRSSECHFYDHRRPIGNKSSIGCTSVLRSAARKKAVFMAEKMFPISAAKNSAIFLAEKEQTKKETPSKGCLYNTYTISRRFSAASSASARCSQNIEAAGTPSPILLPQAAALQKPTGLFADRLRP